MVVIQSGHYHILCQEQRNHWFMLWFSGGIGSTQTSLMSNSVAVSITVIHLISSKKHPVLLLTQSLSAALCKVSRPGFIFKWLSSVLKYSSWPLGSEISGSQHKQYSDTHLVKTQNHLSWWQSPCALLWVPDNPGSSTISSLPLSKGFFNYLPCSTTLLLLGSELHTISMHPVSAFSKTVRFL